MPYKDEEKRRRFDREYKRKIRQKTALSSPFCQPLVRKAYICPKAPNLRLPGIIFKTGIYVTDRPEEQAQIERDPLYGSDIFAWRLEP